MQERLRYLQSQQGNVVNSTAAPLTSNVTPMSPHYQRPMMYNTAPAAPYVHQPMMPQQHPVHYNPQAPQPNPSQDIAIPPSQPVMSVGGIGATSLEDLPMQDQVNN